MRSFTLDDRHLRRLAFAFVLFLSVFETYIIGVNYAEYFAFLVDSETWFFSVTALICIIASFYVFFRFIYFAISASRVYKVVCFLIFALAIIIEYGYQKALGRFSDKIDIETAIAATPEQQLASIAMYFSVAALIPCIIFLTILVLVKADRPRGLRGFLTVTLLAIVCFAGSPLVVSQKFPTFAANAFFRTNLDFLVNGPVATGKWTSSLAGAEIRRREVSKPALPEGYLPKNNIIVIADESVMGDHLSLNGYGRDTTPFLDKLTREKILHNWGLATAASTGSRFTYSALITGLTPDDFPDKTDFKVNTFPTLFQYAKAMNYHTYFFDGQMNGYWGGVADDKNYIDNWQGVLDVSDQKAFDTWELDNLIAKKIKNIIYSSTGNFIFIFKHGSHIPYGSNCPPDQKVWTPSYETADKYDIPSGDQLPSVVNAYDNSIKYNVNSFFQNLIDDYANMPNGTVIVYTGDHGQTLFVNGRASHGGNTKGEATVPLFIIGKLSGTPDTTYKASHANIFPTVLDLMDYPGELRDKRGFPSLLRATAADSRPRFFNPDLGHKIPFD
jgi:glucan phosphoethanolaminetransferase (alkaline phosphatase superfamily)